MSLDVTRLSAAIKSGLLGNSNAQAVNNAALTALCDQIAAAVVAEITGHAVVLPTLLVAPGGGGPVTGTGTIS